MTLPEVIISARNVAFRYESAQEEAPFVVRQLDLSIEKGSFVSVIGHNGSGKSTLAKLCNALLAPSEGVLTVCGFDTRDGHVVWEIRSRVGMVFQNPDNQIVGTTVEEDVAFGLENLGVAPEEMRGRIDESLRAVKMESFADRQPHRLSGGQKQRVAIAGIIAMRPSVIILDEATAMLDPQGRKEVLALVRRLNREEGITILNITHFPEETVDSDRVIVMHAGAVLLDGPPSVVYREVERLQAVGLDVPLASRLRHKLAAQGVQIAPVLHQEELVDELCRLLSNE